jgi:hypothetical protein
MIRNIVKYLSVQALLFTAPYLSWAQFANPLKATDLRGFLLMILNSAVYILFPIIVLMIVYTGFLFVSAQGNESKLTEAKRALVWTVIGGLVVLGSLALALAIEATVDNFTV